MVFEIIAPTLASLDVCGGGNRFAGSPSFVGHTDLLIHSLRGGDGTATSLAEVVDLNRAGLRLSSLEQYAVVGSILLGSIIDIFSDTPKRKESDQTRFGRTCQMIHGISISVGVLSAMYTTVVFTLFGLYAKTALGIGNDEAYLELLKATSAIRLRGFQSFLLCLLSFNVSIIMNMFLNFQDGIIRYVMATMTILGTAVSLSHFSFIVKTASEIIFS